MDQKGARDLAEQIVAVLGSGSAGAGLDAVHAALERINARLDKLEGSVPAKAPASQHPSLDKLSIAEAIVDSIFGSQFKEKACTFEPSKPCDHCSMCNSRGF